MTAECGDALVIVDNPQQPGKRISGWLHVIEHESCYGGGVVIRNPHTRHDVFLSLAEMETHRAEWQVLADGGPWYSDDVREKRPEYRQAMADWWAQAIELAREQGATE